MHSGGTDIREVGCALLWKLSRMHGWSVDVEVSMLVRRAAVQDEKRAREVARTQLARKPFVGYHPGRDTVWLKGPPTDEVFYYLRDECGYSELQIEATFSFYFEGF